MLTTNTLTTDIKQIILQSRETAIRAVDFQRVLMYWHIGKRIFEEEQQGQDRADYGAYLIKELAQQLVPEFGSAFGRRQLELFRQFYRTFPIANAVRSQLNWTQCRKKLRALSRKWKSKGRFIWRKEGIKVRFEFVKFL